MGDVSIDPADDGRSRRKAYWNLYIQMMNDQQQAAAPTQVEQVKHSGASRDATDPESPAQGQQQFTPQQQATRDVVVKSGTAKNWTKQIKSVPKAACPSRVQDLRTFQPAAHSRGAKQAANQHKHLGERFALLSEIDKKLAAYALDKDFKKDLKTFIPPALKEREQILTPIVI